MAFHDCIIIFVPGQNQADGEGLTADTFVSKHVFNFIEDQVISKFLTFSGIAINSSNF